MGDVKVTYTVNGKEFDDYDKAMEYKAEREKNNTDKEELEKLIIDGHEALSQLLERYNALNPTNAEKQELCAKIGVFDPVECQYVKDDDNCEEDSLTSTLNDLESLMKSMSIYLKLFN